MTEPVQPADPSATLDRRSFLGSLGAASVALGLVGAASSDAGTPEPELVVPTDSLARRAASRKMRFDQADVAFRRPLPDHRDNGEEADYPYVANFSKGLPHNQLGEVKVSAYKSMLKAIRTGSMADWEKVPMGHATHLRLKNPQAGLAYDLQGADAQSLTIRPAPRIDEPENSAEMAELYWMAVCRDVPYNDYATDPLIALACEDLSKFSDYRAPKVNGKVTPATIFRGDTRGDLPGPYVSQFMYRSVQYGTLNINQRGRAALVGKDWITTYDEWLDIQKGFRPEIVLSRNGQPQLLDPINRYLRTGRDLATYVHFDALYEAYLNACLILVSYNFFRGNPLEPSAPVDAGNPYRTMLKTCGFGTFGIPHIQTLVTEVATRALKACWFQKWNVHRRIRPEAFAGRIHNHVTGAASYPIDSEILDSSVLDEIFSKNGNYLLPHAFQEGCPLHPAYPSGHATVAGACVTVLKAWFDEDFVLDDPVIPDFDGTDLIPYEGPDAGQLTVRGELNKLAWNICSGRDWAGVHWRSDHSEALKLGEQIAICLLQEQAATFNESGSFSLTKFSGKKIKITF